MSKKIRSKKFLMIFTGFYLSALVYLLFFAFFRTNTNTAVNWIPFKNILELTNYTFRTGHGISHWIVNIPGNILAFVPMAVPLNYLKIKVNRLTYLFVLLAIPVMCEYLQYLFKSGSADVDDVILNVAGIFLGVFLIRRYSPLKEHSVV